MSFCVKAFCQYLNIKQETRRFRIPENEDFAFLRHRIRTVFRLGNDNFTIKWIDEDDDEVNFSNNEELHDALESMAKQRNPDILYLNVTVEGKDNSMPTNCHDGIQCDECDGPVRGFRYKCLHCDDYDLCMSCEARGNHKVHHMIRIPTKDPRANVTFADLRQTVLHGPTTSSGKGFGKEQPTETLPNQKANEPPPAFRDWFPRRCHRRHMNRPHFRHSFSAADGGSHRSGRHRPPFYMDTEAMCNDAARAAEEARNVAMRHATDIMRGIWTGWVGDQNPEATTPTTGPAPTLNEEQAAAKPEGITIDITVNKKDGVKHRYVTEEPIDDDVQPVTQMIEVIDLSKQDAPKEQVQPMETNTVENSENVSEADGWDLINDTTSIHSLSSESASGAASVIPTAVTPSVTPEQDKPDCPPAASGPPSAQPSSTTYMNQRIQWALNQMMMMGYSDENGLLTRLLTEKDGNINEALDALMSGKK